MSTGKKVNSTLENPINFFAAKAHSNRAGDLDALKDGMTEAVQVVKAADQGISAVVAMIESDKGLAQLRRQQLATSSLSMSSQAAQAILRLFYLKDPLHLRQSLLYTKTVNFLNN